MALKESLNVLSRTEAKTDKDPKGGMHGESSIVMKDGTVVKGESGSQAFINSDNELQANETLPDLPAGSEASDVETTIHSHVTGTKVENGQVYSHDATKPSDTDLQTFATYSTNIIVGPLGKASATNTNGTTSVHKPNTGIAIFKGASTGPLTLSKKAVERILKQ